MPGRTGESAANGTDVAAGAEAVVVLAARTQPAQLNMDGVGGLDTCLLHPARYHFAHGGVFGHLPGHGDFPGGHAAQAIFG